METLRFNPEELPIQEEEKNNYRKTPEIVLRRLETYLKGFLGKIELHGEDHLKNLRRDKPVVIAVSHLSDQDVLAAISKLGEYFDVKFAAESVMLEGLGNKTGIALMGGAGRGIPIDYKAAKQPDVFNPENFEPMEQALEQGYAVVVAAHNPTTNWQLADRGGLAVPYLAAMETGGCNIVPVAVNIKSQNKAALPGTWIRTILEHPDVDVTVGEPITVEHVEGVEKLAGLFEKRKAKQPLGKDEIQEQILVKKQIQAVSNEVMQSIASMLPEEKRGKWQAQSVDSVSKESLVV